MYTMNPYQEKLSLVVGITQAHVKRGSICYMPGGIQPSAVGIQRREKSHLTCFLPLGFWQSSCLYVFCRRKSDTGHSETIAGQDRGGYSCYTFPSSNCNLSLVISPSPTLQTLFLFSLNPLSEIQCCRSQPYIHRTI